MKPLAEIVKEAEERKIAVGHFNVSNLEQLKAVVSAAESLKVPVVIGVSESEREFIGLHQIVALTESYRKDSEVPIFLNADHTHSLEKAREAAEAGFDAIVFDGSKLPIGENIRETREAVKITKAVKKDIIVEGEIGYIGSGSEIREELPKGAAVRSEDLTKPEEAVRFVKETGVDMLAPAVGNIHGMFANAPEPRLDIKRIKEIKKAARIPLVLHGGSGNTDEDFLAAINAGISIIHISTELRAAWRKGLELSFKNNSLEVAPYKLGEKALESIVRIVKERLRLFSHL